MAETTTVDTVSPAWETPRAEEESFRCLLHLPVLEMRLSSVQHIPDGKIPRLSAVWQGLDYEKKLRRQRDRLRPSIGSEARWRQTAKMSKNRRSGWGGEGFRGG